MSKAPPCPLLIVLVVQHPGQTSERMGILWGHCQHPFLERFGLAEFAQIAQDRRQPSHGRQMVRGVLQDPFVLGCRSFQ